MIDAWSGLSIACHPGWLRDCASYGGHAAAGFAFPQPCCYGGVLSFLPILGIWMLPFGLALLAEDLPMLRSWRSRILDWVERRHPEWLNSTSHPHDRA
jgi:hypothetical protein